MSEDMVYSVLASCIALPIYFAPTIIAFRRGKQNRFPIGLVNLVMGWTAIGWIGTMAWACLDKPRS
jgi:hypothetical protein